MNCVEAQKTKHTQTPAQHTAPTGPQLGSGGLRLELCQDERTREQRLERLKVVPLDYEIVAAARLSIVQSNPINRSVVLGYYRFGASYLSILCKGHLTNERGQARLPDLETSKLRPTSLHSCVLR